MVIPTGRLLCRDGRLDGASEGDPSDPVAVFSVNQSVPAGPAVIQIGWLALEGIGNSVI